MKKLKDINAEIFQRNEELKLVYKFEVHPRKEVIQSLEDERNEIILKSKFKWEGKTYRVADMLWYDSWTYEDCPYSPGYKYSTETLKIQPINGRPVFFSLPDNKEGWYDRYHKEFREFEEFFIKKFGTSFKNILKIGVVKER